VGVVAALFVFATLVVPVVSWCSGPWDFYFHDLKASPWVTVDFHWIVRRRGANEQVLPLWPTEHHGIGVGIYLDPIRYLAAFKNTHDAILAFRICTPHAPRDI
jgi:hypothetical protein